MTMMMTELIRVHGDEDWEAWGDDWWDHVERVAEAWGVGASSAHRLLRARGFECIQIDWGAFLFAMTKDELIASFGAKAELWPSWPERKRGVEWRKTLADLDPDWRYGLVVVECY